MSVEVLLLNTCNLVIFNLFLHEMHLSGCTNPDYVVTVDDVDKLIAVECVPMDDGGTQVCLMLKWCSFLNI